MTSAEERIGELGLTLPADAQPPPGVKVPFRWVRVSGKAAYVSGHGALTAEGTLTGPFGTVPSEVSLEDAQQSAYLATLAMLASLRRTLGSLDEVGAWMVVNGFVNADPGFAQTTLVMNPCSELLLDVFGSDVGAHARTAIGVATVPFNLPVVISARVGLR
jgi:enamine deaminase RidA (YjgF/YER057c/UK114 family)